MVIVTFPYSGESAHDLMHSGAGRFAVSVIDADAQFRRAARYAPAAGGLATLELDSVERYDAPSADKRLGCIVVEPRLDDWQQLQVLPSGMSSSEHLPLLLVAAEATATAHDVVVAFKSGVSDFLSKPIDDSLTQLINAYRAVLKT